MGENKFGHCQLSDSYLKQHNMVLQHYRTPGDGGVWFFCLSVVRFFAFFFFCLFFFF